VILVRNSPENGFVCIRVRVRVRARVKVRVRIRVSWG
jgi:hypothetical protein